MSTLLIGIPLSLSTLLKAHLGPLRSVGFAFALYYITLAASIICYRLSPFHPLAKYPGPLPAKVSKLWHVWIVARGEQHVYLRRMHEKYGDIVRMGE